LWEGRGYERYLSHIEMLIKRLNAHIPKNRKTLAQLLDEEEPSVEASDGSKIYFRRQDLEKLAENIPRELYGSLRLPIILVRRIELGKGVYVISGGEAERRVVLSMLGIRGIKGEAYLYRPQVSELISKLKSLVTIGFEVPPEE
jgi:hypothetical protein